MNKITGHHATDAIIEEFNLNYLDYGESNFGPGIYFSTKSTNIDYYLNESLEGNI